MGRPEGKKTESWLSSLTWSGRLYDEVTAGRVLWIVGVAFNAMERSLEMTWTSNPEPPLSDGRIRFTNLTEFSMTFDDEFDKDCLADLIGLDEYLDAGFTRYVVHTTNWELVFASAEPPQISRFNRESVLEPNPSA